MPHVTGHFCVCHVELWLLFHDFFPCTPVYRVPGYLGTWVPGYLGTWVPGYLGTWVPGYLGTWVPGYLGTWVPGKTHTFLFAKTRTLFCDNTYTFCVRVIANRKKKYTCYRNLPFFFFFFFFQLSTVQSVLEMSDPFVGVRGGPTVGLTVGPLSPTAGPWCPGAQVPRYPGTQVPRYPGTQVPRYPGTQVPRYPGTQVPRYPGTQVPRYPGTQVPRYPGTQVPRYPGTQVQVQEQVPRNRKKVVKEQPQLHMTNTKVSSHVGHSCTEEIMIQQFTRKIT